MGRLYKGSERSNWSGKVRLIRLQLNNLAPLKTFMQKAVQGISVNWVVWIVHVDAGPQGIRGLLLPQESNRLNVSAAPVPARSSILENLGFLATYVRMVLLEFQEGVAWTDKMFSSVKEISHRHQDGSRSQDLMITARPLVHLKIAKTLADCCHSCTRWTTTLRGSQARTRTRRQLEIGISQHQTELLTIIYPEL